MTQARNKIKYHPRRRRAGYLRFIHAEGVANGLRGENGKVNRLTATSSCTYFKENQLKSVGCSIAPQTPKLLYEMPANITRAPALIITLFVAMLFGVVPPAHALDQVAVDNLQAASGQIDPLIYEQLHAFIVLQLLADCRQVFLADELGTALALPGEAKRL
jgi:hypothetical protein